MIDWLRIHDAIALGLFIGSAVVAFALAVALALAIVRERRASA